MGDLLLEASSEFSSEQKQNDVSPPGKTLQREAAKAAEAGPSKDLGDAGHDQCHIRMQGTVCPGDEEVLSRETGEPRAEKQCLRRKQWHLQSWSWSRMPPSMAGQQIINQEC